MNTTDRVDRKLVVAIQCRFQKQQLMAAAYANLAVQLYLHEWTLDYSILQPSCRFWSSAPNLVEILCVDLSQQHISILASRQNCSK